MGINDFENNFKAIKESLFINPERKWSKISLSTDKNLSSNYFFFRK